MATLFKHLRFAGLRIVTLVEAVIPENAILHDDPDTSVGGSAQSAQLPSARPSATFRMRARSQA